MKNKIILISVACAVGLITIIILSVKSDGFRIEKITLEPNYNGLYTNQEMQQRGYVGILPKYLNSDVSACFQNVDGTKTFEIYASPIKFMNDDGKFSMIDTRITNVTNDLTKSKGFVYKTSNSDILTFYPKKLTKELGILIKKKSFEYTICPENIGGDNATYVNVSDFINKNRKTIEYEKAFGPGTNLRSYPTSLGANCEIVLAKKPNSNKLKFLLNLSHDSVGVSIAPGGYLVMANITTGTDGVKTNNILGIIQAPLVKDSSKQNNSNNNFSYKNSLKIIKQQNGRYLFIAIIDKTFLDNPNTKYPLKVLISFEQRREKQPDSAVYSNKPNMNSYLSAFTILGHSNDYGIGRIFIRYKFAKYFNLRAEDVIKATYYTYNLNAKKRGCSFEMRAVLNDWCSFMRAWNIPINIGERASYMKTDKGEIKFDITKETKKWCNDKDPDGTLEHQGLLLKSTIEEEDIWNVILSNDNSLYKTRTLIVLK